MFLVSVLQFAESVRPSFEPASGMGMGVSAGLGVSEGSPESM